MNNIRGAQALTVLIADDIVSVRQDLHMLLGLIGGLEIVGEAANGEEAVHLAERLRPDVVIMDLEMPVLDGFEATRRIKVIRPGCRVVVLTIHGVDEEGRDAKLAGADAFVVKGAPIEELIAAIRGNLTQE